MDTDYKIKNNSFSVEQDINNNKSTIKLSTPDKHIIPTYYFKNNLNTDNPKAIIQIVHGMCEHYEYYQDFINYFNKIGFDIYLHDQRGHGKSVDNLSELGYLADNNGGDKLISDGILVSEYIKQNHKNIPLILFGHSMGALVAQAMVINTNQNTPDYYKKLILTGSPGVFPGMICKIGKFFISLEIKRQSSKQINGRHAISPINKLLVNYGFNYKFRKEGKLFAWTTRDNTWLDKFLADERAGFIPQNQFWLDLIALLEFVKDNNNIIKMNKNLPIIFLDGAVDPVNNKTRQTKAMIKKLKNIGINNIKHIVYPNARHHLCIEINRQDIFADIANNLN